MPTVELKHSSVSYTETGAGEHVVLIHCSTASGKEWAALHEVLADRFHCMAPDQWGCGRSDPWPGNGPFTLVQEAAPLVELIDRIGMPVHLVGHSYGGGVALRVALERPGMVRSLTLIEPSVFHLLDGIGPEEQKLYTEISDVAEAVKRSVNSGDLWGGMERFTDYWCGPGAWRGMPIEARLKISQRLPKVVLDFRALFAETASLDDYAALSFPVLLVCGGLSPGPSRRIVDILHGAMPNTRLVRIEGAGHMSPFTHADAVNREITRHLNKAVGVRQRAA